MPKGVCAFCGTYGELDREHYIAQRFRKLFPLKSQPGYGQRLSTYDPETKRYRVHTERRAHSPWGLSVQVGKYCCNGAWMAKLDELVAPFLDHAVSPESRAVSYALLCMLAGWGAKVAALHELSGQPTSTAISPDDRRHIKRHRRPPRGTYAWVTASEWRPSMLPGVDQTTLMLSERPIGSQTVKEKNTHSTTIFFGHVTVFLFGTTLLRRLRPPEELRDRMIPIWPDPPRRGAMWPAGPLLTEREAVGLSRSIEYSFSGRIAPR